MIPIAPELGPWPFCGFPSVVELGGRVYRLSSWAFPYAGVVAQYRQAQPELAAHLQVLEDGSYLVDHLDESNPDFAPIAHLIDDVIGADPSCRCNH